MPDKVSEDILLLIFDSFSGPALLEWPRDTYSHERACAPFILAAVSRRWRFLAQSTSTLWTYFGFPPDSKLHGQHFARLQILLPLVKHTLVDVVFTRNQWEYDRVHPDTISILKVLTQLATQWRSADFDLGIGISDNRRTSPFKDISEELANLEQLSLSFSYGVLQLFNAPRLLRLHLSCDGVDLDHRVPYMPDLMAFSCGPCTDTTIKDLCLRVSGHLLELTMVEGHVYRHIPWGELPAALISFPCLSTLVLQDGRRLAHLDTPNLQTLAVKGGPMHGININPLGHVGIEHLILFGSLNEQVIHNAEHIQSISTLSFSVPEAIRKIVDSSASYYEVLPAFFTELALVQPPVWPALERVEFGSSIFPIPFQQFLGFIESRNLARGQSGGRAEWTARPSSIKKVILPLGLQAPEWFTARLEELCPHDAPT
ncbi:hypothetical protein BKA62DRAFT_704361 [Auriculariales sp. MPI-PUGE-AT-0066]|nr:hypothetical protein BKA62DRAFT_704361 [Auriculariales sp. MPI-PUGE-AT-0066]